MLIRQWSGNPLGVNYDYAYTDHLGSITGWSDTAGVYPSNSIALHEPFGAYRFRPPASVNPGISDRGYTGHRMNNTATNDLGLIYMNARYYLPEVGRFISADTIVPEPSNPQSFNRYAYVQNNPVNITDPTGHRECHQETLDCSHPQPHLITGSLVKFTGDWESPEKAPFHNAASQMAQAMFEVAGDKFNSPREVILAVFNGAISVTRSSQSCAEAFSNPSFTCYGSATATNITVYTNANGHIEGNEMWALHEMFHSFNGNSAGQPYTDLRTDPIIVSGITISPSGGLPRTLDGYLPGKRGTGSRTPYVNSWNDHGIGEDFADMGANWAAGSFADDGYGAARSRWMDTRMQNWISLAVNQN